MFSWKYTKFFTSSILYHSHQMGFSQWNRKMKLPTLYLEESFFKCLEDIEWKWSLSDIPLICEMLMQYMRSLNVVFTKY